MAACVVCGAVPCRAVGATSGRLPPSVTMIKRFDKAYGSVRRKTAAPSLLGVELAARTRTHAWVLAVVMQSKARAEHAPADEAAVEKN